MDLTNISINWLPDNLHDEADGSSVEIPMDNIGMNF